MLSVIVDEVWRGVRKNGIDLYCRGWSEHTRDRELCTEEQWLSGAGVWVCEGFLSSAGREDARLYLTGYHYAGWRWIGDRKKASRHSG